MAAPKKIRKVMVANRGEIARRICRTLSQKGLLSVGLFIASEKNAPYLNACDETYPLQKDSLSAFLDMDALINIAKETHVDAIHPGYGFLSENADFAKRVEDEGMIWIGPSPEVIALLGNKEKAKEKAKACNVPVLDYAFETQEQDADFEKALANMLRPLIIKPMMGGGGKGMAILRDGDQLKDVLAQSRSIAKNAFGDGRLMAEPFMEAPKHVEIQVVRDGKGNTLILGSRDCTIQRRHQKIIEEAPSKLDAKLLERMENDARVLMDDVGYQSVGTVEFLVDEKGTYCFMEVNTRLQVEHVVTEMIYDVDLVDMQLDIAQGKSLAQKDVQPEGHAIEVRIYAEDADRDFLPATGTISLLNLPEEKPWIRVDHSLQKGQKVTSVFDPMLMKLTVWADSRPRAIEELTNALSHVCICGVVTNHTLVDWVLGHEDFQTMKHHTQWLSQNIEDYHHHRDQRLQDAVTIWQYQTWEQNMTPWAFDPWNAYASAQLPSISNLRFVGKPIDPHLRNMDADPMVHHHFYFKIANAHWIFFDNQWYVFHEAADVDAQSNAAQDQGIKAPMTGTIIKIHAKEGDTLKKDQVIIEMEAMKMQYKLVSPSQGTLEKLLCNPQEVVQQDQLLAKVQS